MTITDIIDITFYSTVIIYAVTLVVSLCMAKDYQAGFKEHGVYASLFDKLFYRCATVGYFTMISALGYFIYSIKVSFTAQGFI